jgi:NAD(P)H dehydrogenase (quinone)
MTVAITGITGHLGRLVIARLKSAAPAMDVIGLARSPDRAADLGLPIREADYERPATLEHALKGIDTLLLISASELGKRARQHRNIIDAAMQTGVKRIIYTSLLHADTSTLNLAGEHLETERMLQGAGIPHTILRNGWYTENYTGSVKDTVASGTLVGSAGEGRISSAPRADYADAAVQVLTGQGHDGRTYELAGDTAWTLTDLAAEISRQTGKSIPYRNLPEADYAATLQGFGVPPGFARAIASWDVSASQGALFDDSHELSKLIGHATTPMPATVAQALA